MNNSPIVVISGCTASGKSELALKLASEIDGVIINADSRQLYKEMSMGTAKPIPESVEKDIWYIDGIQHYLYSHVSVKEKYNLYRYQKDVFDLLKRLPSRKIPILVGGTGLYIDSVVFNYKLKNEVILNNEKNDYEQLSIKEIQKLVPTPLLNKLNNSEKNNRSRLIRIIEKGMPSIKKGNPLSHIYFFLDIEKGLLEKRIIERVDTMFRDGLLEENIRIRETGLNKFLPLQTIGYREFDEYFENKITIEDVKDNIVTHTKQYAKRQRTWFRRNKGTVYINRYDNLEKETKKYLSSLQ